MLIAGIALFASALGTAVAEAGHDLAPGAAVCMAGGIVLFYVASVAESIRYGVPWRDVVTWGIAGVVLPWVVVPLAVVVHAEAVVAAVVLLIVVMIGLAEANQRRTRAERGSAAFTR